MKWPQSTMARVDRLVLRRNSILTIVVLASMLVGGLSGAVLGVYILRQRAELIADQSVQRVHATLIAALQEEKALIDEMARAPYPLCSEADVRWMRMLVFHSNYISEAGHMLGDRLICTSSLGELKRAGIRLKPELTLATGVHIYLNPAPYQKQGTNYVGVGKHGQFVIFRPTIEAFFVSAPFRYAISVLDARQKEVLRSVGTLRETPVWILNRTSVFWKQSVYATRCENRSNVCVTASLPLVTAFSYASSGVILTTLAGVLAGLMMPILMIVLSRRGYLMAWQLRQAIRANKLRVVYMPVVDLDSRAVVGAEALVRWNDNEGRPVLPEVFVRVAEKHGFVGEITRLVVQKTMAEMSAHLRENPQFRLSINATAGDFGDPEFLPMLKANLQGSGVEPESLIIEITESSTARHEVVGLTIKKLRERGFHVHIDDFGTGYSSLAYLHELNIDAIKIDRSFTQAIGNDAVRETILPQVMSMADSLGLEVVVEGVETEQQASYFASLGKPRLAQGWLFGAPVPVGTFFDLYNVAETARQSTDTVSVCDGID